MHRRWLPRHGSNPAVLSQTHRPPVQRCRHETNLPSAYAPLTSHVVCKDTRKSLYHYWRTLTFTRLLTVRFPSQLRGGTMETLLCRAICKMLPGATCTNLGSSAQSSILKRARVTGHMLAPGEPEHISQHLAVRVIFYHFACRVPQDRNQCF